MFAIALAGYSKENAYPTLQDDEIHRQKVDDKLAESLSIVARVANKDPTALGELYDRYSVSLFSLALKISKSRAEAEDALQESFLQVWRSAPNYRSERGSVFTWLVMIVRGRAIDALRKNSRFLANIRRASGSYLRDDTHLPSQTLAMKEKCGEMRKILSKLRNSEQRVIDLAFFDGLTHEEISASLSLPVGTVKARIRRGMLKLRDMLRRQPA